MVDRLEELLEMMEAGDEDEQREDVLALTDRTAPAPASPKEDDGEAAPADPAAIETGRDTPLTAEAPAPGRDVLPEGGPEVDAAMPAAEAALRRELAEMPEKAAAEAVLAAGKSRPETPGPGRSAEQGGEPAQAAGREVQGGLEELYRRAAQAARPAAQNLPVEQAGRTHQAEEPGRTAALTVDELDRAVRRDSRRYDGSMSIF